MAIQTEALPLIFHIILSVICAHFVFYNVELFDRYILRGFFHALLSDSLTLKFPSFSLPTLIFTLPTSSWPKFKLPRFRLPAFKLPSFKLPSFKLPTFKLPTFKLPTFKLPTFKLPTFKLPAVEVPRSRPLAFKVNDFKLPAPKLPQISLSVADFSAIIKLLFSYLGSLVVFVLKFLIACFWFPPIFAIIVGITYLDVLDLGHAYTLNFHGEQSLVAFQVIAETYATPFFALVFIYNFVNWLVTPIWSPIESSLLGWLIRLTISVIYVIYLLLPFLQEAFVRIRIAYTRFDILQARLRMRHDPWEISAGWRHTKLSRFMQRLARWTFDRNSNRIPFYGRHHPQRPQAVRDLRNIQLNFRAEFMLAGRVSVKETLEAMRQYREDYWFAP
ncbi:hypothetical protein K449DRAFT_466644 [Hypoxylon sp. EC38]|nr:hypothetical protein K449DRAFT_466644 [Hypoxylon sp. EC38]